jgi:hypothetical protein
MVHLEEWMEIHEMHQIDMSQSQIAERLGLDRKTVRKYLHRPPEGNGARVPRPWKLDPYRSYLRERWEQDQVREGDAVAGEVTLHTRGEDFAGGAAAPLGVGQQQQPAAHFAGGVLDQRQSRACACGQ